MARVHPLACVAPEAVIADDVEIGPYCTIGPQVTLAAGCRLIAHVNVTGITQVGERSVIHNFASLGGPPQSLAYAGEATRLEIGADCTIREGVTMNIGTAAGGGVTRVGARGFYMAYAHVGHDCAVGDDVILAHGAVLGGHCSVGNHVFVGGLTAVHQRVRIGTGAMLGGSSGLRADLIPFGTVLGVPADLIGLNVVGMKRRGVGHEERAAVRRAYRALFFGDGVFADRLARVAAEEGAHPSVTELVDFIRSGASRPLCHPGRKATSKATPDGDGGA